MTILVVHGVSSNSKGYDYTEEELLETLEKTKEEVVFYSWAEMLDSSIFGTKAWGLRKLFSLSIRNTEYVNDTISYFLGVETRLRCITDLTKKIEEVKPTTIIAHSLGSVLAWQVLQQLPMMNAINFIIIGSPLWVLAIRFFLKITPLPENAKVTILSGIYDAISGFGRFWTPPGKSENISSQEVVCGHDLIEYFNWLKILKLV